MCGMSLAGRTVFITGASRGIGLAIGLRAAADGANIVVTGKTVEPHPKLPGTIHTAAEALEQAGGQALAVAMDVREEPQVKAAVRAAIDRFGGIDVLVNNASAIYLTGTLETPIRRFDLMHEVNVRGTYLTTQHCLPHRHAAHLQPLRHLVLVKARAARQTAGEDQVPQVVIGMLFRRLKSRWRIHFAVGDVGIVDHGSMIHDPKK